jgi:HSP20 family molecular chaperone IbpA
MSKLDRRETSELSKAPEQTRPGPVYTPAADIFESEDSITLLADLPGVGAPDLTIDLRDSVLTLTGRARAPTESKESPLLREFGSGTFYRQFTLSDTIDQSKIDAKLVDGVLRLELPKAERAKPRRITVKSA